MFFTVNIKNTIIMIWRNNEALEILIALIRVLRIKVCKSYLEQLLDTPMGNSMRGMSDALDKLCIKNNVYKLPKESLNSAPTPIIAVLKNANHPFCVVVSISENNIARSMNSLRGGSSIICHSLQALANNKDVTAHWTSKDWDAWADQWEKNAC